MTNLRHSSSLPAMLLLVAAGTACLAQTQANIQQSAAIACAVMSGQRKADGQALQLLLWMDDIGEANPVMIALHREVLKQCNQAYLDYEQRKRAANPFPPGSLVNQTSTPLVTQTPTQLVNAKPDYPIRCRGIAGMASTEGATLIVNFKKRNRPADQLLPGQCSWLDRAMRAKEPTRIADVLPNADQARSAADHINAGDTWTFWVINSGNSLQATASAKGSPNHKP